MELLDPREYHKLSDPIQKVTINNLFARWVIEGHIPGKVYVDNRDHPNTFYVVHPYGMSLLFGECSSAKFNDQFKEYAFNLNGVRDKSEWMQAFPDDWNLVLNALFKDHLIKSSDNHGIAESGNIELNTRVNFKFNQRKYIDNRKEQTQSDCRICRTTRQLYEQMKGSVVPAFFWRNSDHFFENGIGFSLLYKGKLATTAYSAFLLEKKLELGIETRDEFRGRGFAYHTCCALINYCIETGFEPVWACKQENKASLNLAQKLGFEPVAEIPYYRLGG